MSEAHTRVLPAEAGAAGRRVDVWLREQIPGLSRARIQALIRAGDVRIDDHPVSPHARLHGGEVVRVEIPPPRPAGAQPQPLALDIVHEDGDIIVVNKPPGLVVHPAAGHPDGTLVNALLFHCADLKGVGGEQRPGIVHRLDRDTSGVMVVAKHDAAMAALVRQFKAGEIAKQYAAIVLGVPEPAGNRIETLMGRSQHDRTKMSAVPARGRRAVTHYRVVEAFGVAALLEVRIETGRTHQIRVHMAHRGYPVLGDKQYGKRTAPEGVPTPARQMLHAQRLGFCHPGSGEAAVFEAPLPEDMTAVLEVLRAAAERIA